MKKTLLFVLLAVVLAAGCQQNATLEKVKAEVSQMKSDVQTVELAYRANGQVDAADRMLGYVVQIDKLSDILETDLPENQCEAVQAGFKAAIDELIATGEKPEYVILTVMFKRMVEGYVCEGVQNGR